MAIEPLEGRAPAILEGRMPAIPAAAGGHRPDTVRAGLIGFGLYELARGIAPAGPCVAAAATARADNADRAERAALDLPLGFALLAAVRRRTWRAPLLAVGSLSWTMRAVRQLTGARRSRHASIGRLTGAKMALGAGMLGWLFARASRAERWAAS